jgi:ABC-type phosphate transport system substrate-binding protein
MKSLSARRIVPACVVSVAAIAALAAPGTAGASLLPQCTGTSPQEAQGSSLQADAQQHVWGPKFDTSKAKSACGSNPTHKPVVTYVSTSSGKGFAKWAAGEFAQWGFIGTDNTVNPAEKTQLEAEAEEGSTGGEILTIPVAQASVAVVMNLPKGCTAKSSIAGATTRLVLTQKQLQAIFSGGIKTWNEITGNGDELLGGAGCESSAPIIPVVRKDASGTTHIFKRFLNWTEKNSIKVKNSKGEAVSETWDELSELGESLVWPEAITPERGEKGSGLLEKVGETAGSIGYAVLAEAREFGFTGASKFWVELESENKHGKVKFQDPSENGLATKASNSNCKKIIYSNGSKTFPPPSAKEPWNNVTADQFSKTYPLCGLTYDLALANYAAFKNHATTQGEATTVENYLAYVTEKKGGQKEIAGHDYLAMPAPVAAKAQQGVKLINWTP